MRIISSLIGLFVIIIKLTTSFFCYPHATHLWWSIDQPIKWRSNGWYSSIFTCVQICHIRTKILGVASGKHNVPTKIFKYFACYHLSETKKIINKQWLRPPSYRILWIRRIWSFGFVSKNPFQEETNVRAVKIYPRSCVRIMIYSVIGFEFTSNLISLV